VRWRRAQAHHRVASMAAAGVPRAVTVRPAATGAHRAHREQNPRPIIRMALSIGGSDTIDRIVMITRPAAAEKNCAASAQGALSARGPDRQDGQQRDVHKQVHDDDRRDGRRSSTAEGAVRIASSRKYVALCHPPYVMTRIVSATISPESDGDCDATPILSGCPARTPAPRRRLSGTRRT